MAKYFGKHFRQLESEWQKKLEESGFKDIECLKNGQRLLRQSASNVYRHCDERTRLAREQYFQSLSNFVNNHLFFKDLDRIVMTKYADGVTISQIVIDLRSQQIKIHRQTIRFIIRRYEHLWGLRYWTAKERNLLYG